MGAYHIDLAKNVAKCGDGEVRIQRALKLANVDLGCLNAMAFPSLFLHFLRQLFFPCSYLIRGTIPTSLLVLVENIFTPLYIYVYISVKMAVPWDSLTLLSFHSLCLHLRSHLTKGKYSRIRLHNTKPAQSLRRTF